MQTILADEAPSLKITDIARLFKARSVFEIIRFIHGARKTEGVIGEAAEGAIRQAMLKPSIAAVDRLLERVPDDLREFYSRDTLIGDGRLIWLADEAGNFCVIARDDARIGTAEEIWTLLRAAACRTLSTLPSYEAAVAAQSLSRTTLKVVN